MARSDCAQFEIDLSALIDGELEPSRRGEVELHVAACGTCRALLETLRADREQLSALPRVRAPETLAMFIQQRAERRALFGEAESVPRGRFWLWFARVSASAALLISGAFVTWRLYLATNTTPAPAESSRPSPDNPRIAQRVAPAESPNRTLGREQAGVSGAEAATAASKVDRQPDMNDAALAPPSPAGQPVAMMPLTEDTVAITCMPATPEQYSMVLGTLRQQVATVLAERTMAATVSHNDRNGYQPFLYDVLKVEYVRGDDNQRSMKMSVRVNADAAPHLLAMFEQVAPNCVHVNVPWSRREEIGRMLFAQAAPPESEPVKTPARAVFAQTLESWLSEEFRSLRGDADGPTSRPNGAKSPEIAHAAANDEPAARRAGAEKAEVSMDKGIPPAATVIGAQILIPDSLRRIPKIVYSRGGELVQSLFGSLIEPRPKLEKVDAVILEIEIITPRGASAD